MTRLINLVAPSQATFGRDGAMFESLLGFVAQLSLVLWLVVTVTVLIRFAGIRFYRHAARRAHARREASDALDTGGTFSTDGTVADAHAERSGPSTAVLPVVAATKPLQPEDVPAPTAAAADMVHGVLQEVEALAALPAARTTGLRAPGSHAGKSSTSAHWPVLASNSTER